MPKISQSTIERVHDAPILDVVRTYIHDLKKNGTTGYKAISPWSNEKTASFYVVPGKNIFKDFSSGKGGGPVRFVMEKEQCTYYEAVHKVANICNEVVEYDNVPDNYKEETDHREALYKINEAAARKYAEQLKRSMVDQSIVDGETTIDHRLSTIIQSELTKRQYTQDTIIQFQLGYAPGDTAGYQPNQWKFITALAGDKSYQTALEAGLINTKNGHTYDVFRHRLMFPIHNTQGRIVSFGGRALPTTVEASPSLSERGPGGEVFKPAKYLNGSESKIFHKESILYGLYFATKAIRDCGYAYLMEGYTDVISFHQAGYNNAVATCGTALTPKQCELLKRYCKKVVLFRDGDDAGERAALRDIDLLVQHGFEVSIVPMPEFEDGRKVDPDDLVRMFKPVANEV
jgi:DNA primase